MGCLADHTINDFILGRLAADKLDHVDEHLDACDVCKELVVHVARSLASADTATDDNAADDKAGVLARGSMIGRHAVLDRIGTGGMGVVYSAHDADLDRKVALKLLRVAPSSHADVAAESERLLREARAMAKLSHPNVVRIYETSMADDAVVLVMELIDGQTLADWLVESSRSWQDIVRVFAAAGQGLAAAHAAGIVHGDFKPRNVLIGSDARVCVTDFGLARFDRDSSVTDLGTVKEPHDLEATLLRTMTTSGAIAGTPAYMAREQFLGKPATMASDQFSFCVALYEALFGKRPFPGTSLAALKAAVVSGEIEEVDNKAGAPSWLVQLTLHGLRSDPKERHDSMATIVARLEQKSRRPYHIALLAAGAALLLGLGALGYAATRPERGVVVCGDSGSTLAAVWNADAKAKVYDAFLQSKRVDAQATFERLEAVLDSYANKWVSIQEESCQATHVRGEQSAELLDLRTECLHRELDEFGALVTLLATVGDPSTMDHAISASLSLGDLRTCSNAERLRSTLAPPAPGIQQDLSREQAALDQVKALQRTARFAEALAQAEPILSTARALDYKPFTVQTLLALGGLYDSLGVVEEAEASYSEARDLAAQLRDHYTVSEASVQLVRIIGYDKSRVEEAMELSRWAQAQVAQAGNDAVTLAKLHTHKGLLYSLRGDYAEAMAEHQAALTLREQALGASDLSIAESLHNMGGVNWQQGKLDEAFALMRRAATISEEALGPDHPEVGKSIMGLGMVLRRQEKYQEAATHYQRALKIFEGAYGRQHRTTSSAIDALAIVFDKQGLDDQALDLFKEALATREALFGAQHQVVADSLNNIGLFLTSRDRAVEALGYFEKALAIRQALLPVGHPKMGTLLLNIGSSYAAQGLYPQARQNMAAGIAILAQVKGRELALAESQFALAQLLADHFSEPKEAMRQAQSARVLFVAQGGDGASFLPKIEAWIDEHTKP